MRIIAKNHDYYDSALAFGHDPHVVFERVEQKFTDYHKSARDGRQWPDGYHFMQPRLSSTNAGYRPHFGVKSKNGHPVQFIPFTVAFCGKLYPGVRVHVMRQYPMKDEDHFAYDFERYAKVLGQLGVEFVEPRNVTTLSHRGLGSPRNEKHCEEYFARAGEDRITFFAERRQPIVIWDETMAIGWTGPTLHVNPELKKWEFYKVFDAYTAFQELDMFVGGIMSREHHVPNKATNKLPNPVQIGDRDLRDKKGFDDMSFKKAPTKRR